MYSCECEVNTSIKKPLGRVNVRAVLFFGLMTGGWIKLR